MDQTVIESDVVELRGSASDPDGTIESIQWRQTYGPEVLLYNPQGLASRFDAPRRWETDGLIFELTVRDDDGAEVSDEVIVFIEPDFVELAVSQSGMQFIRRSMREPIEFLQLTFDPAFETRIVLRSYLFNNDIEVYSRPDLLPEHQLASSYEPGLANDEIVLDPGTPSPVYLAIFGWYGDQYTVTGNQPHEFLEDGFPTEVVATGGTNQAGALHRSVTIGNIDADPELEILFSAVAQGPLYAFNHDGTAVNGWPVRVDYYTTYPSLGNLLGGSEIHEIALGLGPTVASCHPDRYLLDGRGAVLPGWPLTACNAGTTTPPTLFDLDDDGIDEVFFGARGFYANGQPIPVWGDGVSSGLPAIADVSGDGDPDFVFQTVSPLNDIEAFDRAGNLLPGFPVVDDAGETMVAVAPPVLGDLDGDGVHEIIRMRKPTGGADSTLIEAYDGGGNQRWQTYASSRVATTTAPAMGDLDGDGLPEILLQTSEELYVWRGGDGSVQPGFPVTFRDPALPGLGHRSAPLVGDVTGDGAPNVVVGDGAFIWVFDTAGVLLHQIRVSNGVVSALADVDLDGRNEIAVAANNWNGIANERFDSVWLFDLGGGPHGPIQWGQVGGSARRNFSYPPETIGTE